MTLHKCDMCEKDITEPALLLYAHNRMIFGGNVVAELCEGCMKYVVDFITNNHAKLTMSWLKGGTIK